MASTASFGDWNRGLQAAIINGNVDATFHLPPERPETPPSPSIVIPFPRDADFVERGTTLDQLQQRCAAPDGRAALVGLGGVGKSQLAIKHAYRTYKQSPETWVFWVHASNADRFRESYRVIADRVKIAGRRDPQANIFKLVHDWLCDCKQRWLLVLDNVDDAHFLLSGQADGVGQGQATNAQARPMPRSSTNSAIQARSLLRSNILPSSDVDSTSSKPSMANAFFASRQWPFGTRLSTS